MEFAGNIRQTDLPQVLREIERSQRTGRLSVSNGQMQAAIYFANGQWLLAERSGPGQLLAQQFVKAGLVTPQQIEAACSDDLQKYCSTVTPGEGRLILCMQAHEDKVSEKCDFAVFQASRNLSRALDRIDRAADICWGDIEKFCSHVPEGGGRILQCLASQKASLTSACRTELGRLPSLN